NDPDASEPDSIGKRKVVSITPGRKGFTEGIQIAPRQRTGFGEGPPCRLVNQGFTFMVHQHGVTRIPHAVGILSDTVDTDHWTQVFDGPRLQQYPPGMPSGFRPVGDAQNGIILEMLFRAGILPQPHGKAQVIANGQKNAKALEGGNHPIVSHGITLVLTGHAKQVALVIMNKAAVRSRPDQTVEVLAGLNNRHATRDHAVSLARVVEQPGHSGTLRTGLGLITYVPAPS